jgi:hypothetical protein
MRRFMYRATWASAAVGRPVTVLGEGEEVAVSSAWDRLEKRNERKRRGWSND